MGMQEQQRDDLEKVKHKIQYNPIHVMAGAAMLVLLCWWSLMAFTGYSAVIDVIDGERYWWLADDAMISMRYAHNLADGHGLVWNPGGERVEGFSNPLWVLVMALVHLLPVPLAKTSLVIIILNIALAVGAIPLIVRLVREIGGGVLAVGVTLTVYVMSNSVMVWTLAGSETILLMVLLLLATLRVLRDSARQRPSLLTFGIIGLLTLVRSDAFVLAGALYGATFFRIQGSALRLRSLGFIGISLLIPLSYLVFRIAYYGDFLPNTAYLKVMAWDGRLMSGLGYVGEVVVRFMPLILIVAATLAWRPVSFPLVVWLPLLLQILYIGYVGGDVFPMFRLLVPVLPTLFAMTFVVIERTMRDQAGTPLGGGQASLILLCLLAMPLIPFPTAIPGYPKEFAVGNIEIALTIKNRGGEKQVADAFAGIPFYFAGEGVEGIDLLGKNDPYIARLPARYGDTPGHNKMALDYSLGVLQPTLVIATYRKEDVEKGEAWLRTLADKVPWLGQLYFNETFRTHCLPYPVETETWRTIYACEW
jgi:hypothetical protein